MKTMSTHPLLLDSGLRTTVTVLGAGGTGSHLVEALALMHQALVQLGHNGLQVSLFDDDLVEPHNIGRQFFGPGDLRSNKAAAVIARVNRMYGLAWRSNSARFDTSEKKNMYGIGNIVVTCVDNGTTRNRMHHLFKALMARQRPDRPPMLHDEALQTLYWLDIGNDDRFGQFVLSSGDLPTCVDRFGLYDIKETGPSCSAEESLRSQDLFINRIMADHAANLLWDLFRRGRIDKCGGYINLREGTMRPMPIP
jgi:PRTRC genetic system ThiF family protein